MQITDIKIRRIYQDSRLRALVSLTIGGELAVHDIKVIEGPERLFVAMPSRRDDNGVFRDICHPITSEARRQLEDAILDTYHQYMESLHSRQETDGAVHNAQPNYNHLANAAHTPPFPPAENYNRLPPQ